MTNENARVLQFTGRDIGRDINLMLLFDTPKGGELFVNLFPICWKVVNLQAVGHATASVTYTANTAFFIPQIEVENLVTASDFQPCSVGQKCTVINDAGGEHVVSAPVTGEKGFLECINNVAVATNIGLGLVDKTSRGVEFIHLWKRVGAESNVKAKFTPVLKVYASTSFQETQILKADVETPLLWTQDLESLDAQTQLVVAINDITGQIEINVA